MDEVSAMAADGPPRSFMRICLLPLVEPKPTKPSNISKRVEFALGDLDKGFAEAEVIVEGTYSHVSLYSQGYIEPHAAIANIDPDNQSIVHCSSQGQYMVRAYCCKLLGLEANLLKVIPAELGGGLWRKDGGLPRTGRTCSISKSRATSTHGYEPRRGISWHRTHFRFHYLGEDRSEEERHNHCCRY